jgi:hypothetical protein
MQPKSSSRKVKRVHYNPAQIKHQLIGAQTTLVFGGRAIGKTVGFQAPQAARNTTSMPRGNHGIASATYEKVLTDILPKLKKGWEMMGYYEDKHYFVRSWAPDNLRIPKPYFAPELSKNIVHWYNGACNRLISVDRPSLFAGIDLDSLSLDEVRFAKKEAVSDLIKTVRGNVDIFGHIPGHHSILMTTDMPRDMAGDWLFDFEDEVEEEKIQMIIKLQIKMQQLRHELTRARTKRAQKAISNQMSYWQSEIEDLRKGLVSVQYASSLENVHVLGLDTIKQWKKTLSAEEFAITVLTEKRKQYGRYFYSGLDIVKHGYTATRFDVYDELSNEGIINPRWYDTQKDIDDRKPLELAGDFNAAIVWLVVGQKLDDRLNITGSLYAKKPQKVKDLAKMFDYHYGPKKKANNKVIFHYDQTAIGANGMNYDTYIKTWKEALKDLGWNVKENYYGAAPTHDARYKLYMSLLDETDMNTTNLAFNKNTNAKLIETLERTPVRRSGDSFKKDKTSEYSKVIPPEDATHGTEAFDGLVWGCEVNEYRSSKGFFNTLTGR